MKRPVTLLLTLGAALLLGVQTTPLWSDDWVQSSDAGGNFASPQPPLESGRDRPLDPSLPPLPSPQRLGHPIAAPVLPQDGPTEDDPFIDDPDSVPYAEHSDNEHDIWSYHTTGAPMPGDGGYFFEFPEDPEGPVERVVESIQAAITWPNEPLGNFLAKTLHLERDELETELHHEAIGIQYIPERPPLIIEWNERFLGPGELGEGFTTPGGAVWRPALWVWGEVRSAIQHYDNGVAPPVTEWANRVDLFAQLNLSGTERIVYGVRPVDQETLDGSARRFAGYDIYNGNWTPGGNFDIQTLFFEGDFGELFPKLAPYDFVPLDIGFSVGRMPLLAQQGLLINEDRLDAVTLTRNTLNGLGNLNLRITGVYAWDRLTRNGPTAAPQNQQDNNSKMVALLTESDYKNSMINADAVYVDGDALHGDLWAFGVSSVRRHYMHHNVINTSLNVLGSFPINGKTEYADQGELLFAQISWTPHHYHDLVYLNAFWAIDQFTSPARGPLMGGPLGQTGVLFAGAGVGRAGPALAVRTDNLAGASLGYQWFFNETRDQFIWEVGGVSDTNGLPNRSAIATAVRYQKAIGQHFILVLDGGTGKAEGAKTEAIGRAEVRVKF